MTTVTTCVVFHFTIHDYWDHQKYEASTGLIGL